MTRGATIIFQASSSITEGGEVTRSHQGNDSARYKNSQRNFENRGARSVCIQLFEEGRRARYRPWRESTSKRKQVTSYLFRLRRVEITPGSGVAPFECVRAVSVATVWSTPHCIAQSTCLSAAAPLYNPIVRSPHSVGEPSSKIPRRDYCSSGTFDELTRCRRAKKGKGFAFSEAF